MPKINLAAAIRLDIRHFQSHSIYSITVEAANSPCLHKMLSYVNTFECEYSPLKKVVPSLVSTSGKAADKLQIAKSCSERNFVSLYIAKQAHGVASTASAHPRNISGSMLVPSPVCTPPVSPRLPAEVISTAQKGDCLAQASKNCEELNKGLQVECDRPTLALAISEDQGWVPAEAKRASETQEVDKIDGRNLSRQVVGLAEHCDKKKVLPGQPFSRTIAREGLDLVAEDAVNALKRKHAEDLATLKNTVQKEKRTMQAIIDDQAKDLEAARQDIARKELSAKATSQKGGSLLSDNLTFVEAQKKIRDQLIVNENNPKVAIPQSHTCKEAKTGTKLGDHTRETSETQCHTETSPLVRAKEKITELEKLNIELTGSKNDLTSQLKTTEEHVEHLECRLKEANHHVAETIRALDSSNVDLQNKVHTVSEDVNVQENLMKNAQHQLKADTAAYESMLKNQTEYYQQSLTPLKTTARNNTNREARLRKEITARFQKQYTDDMKEKAKLRKEADARLEKKLLNIKSCGEQMVESYAHLGIDLLDYLLKLEKCLASKGYVIRLQEYHLFVAKARSDLVLFKRGGDDDAIFYGKEEGAGDGAYEIVAEKNESMPAGNGGKFEGDLRGEESAGQGAMDGQPRTTLEDVEGKSPSNSTNPGLKHQAREEKLSPFITITKLKLWGEDTHDRDGLSDPKDAKLEGRPATESSFQDEHDKEETSTLSASINDIANHHPPKSGISTNLFSSAQPQPQPPKTPTSPIRTADCVLHSTSPSSTFPPHRNANHNTTHPPPPTISPLNLSITSFADTSRSVSFTTPPPSPPLQKPSPPPKPITENAHEPRTKLGKTRAEVVVEVAAALALRKIEEEKDAAEKEKGNAIPSSSYKTE